MIFELFSPDEKRGQVNNIIWKTKFVVKIRNIMVNLLCALLLILIQKLLQPAQCLLALKAQILLCGFVILGKNCQISGQLFHNFLVYLYNQKQTFCQIFFYQTQSLARNLISQAQSQYDIIFQVKFLYCLVINFKLQDLKMGNLNIPSFREAIKKSNSQITHNVEGITQKTVQQPLGQKKIRKYKKKAKPLTPQQIEVFRQAFQIFDSNHSGSIDQSQLKSLMGALGYNYDEKKLKQILQEIDEDGSGVIQINQFVDFMSTHMLDTQNLKKQIKKVFTHFDDDGEGYLDFRKLKNMSSECFFNLDDESIRNMIVAADTDQDGKINQYQFFRIMKKVKLI